MSTVIVTADIVGSTEIKERYDQATAAKKISQALNSVRDDLCGADESLRCPVPYAGDSILLIGGCNAVEIYRAAVIHQAQFRAWPYGRMPIKLALGFGVFETVKSAEGHSNYHGTDLDLLYAVASWCPPGGLVVTQAMFSVLEDAGFGRRFHERHEILKGFGERIYYESNGDYRMQRPRRQRIKKGVYSFLPQSRLEFTAFMTVGGTLLAMALAYLLYWG